MIELKDVEYDKSSGIITAVAMFREYSEKDYPIIIDTKTWEVIGVEDDTPKTVLSKCKYRYKEVISNNEEIKSHAIIMWY